MKNTKIIKITTCCISTTIPMLALFGCAKATAVSSEMGPKVQATAKPTATPTASATPSASAEPEPIAEAEPTEEISAQVETESSSNDGASNNYSAPSTPVPPAPEPVSTPAIPEPTAIPTPVPTPVPSPEPVDESCHLEPLGNCHVGVCMSRAEVIEQGEAWSDEHGYDGGVTYGDEDWDGCYVYYTNDGQFQVGVD